MEVVIYVAEVRNYGPDDRIGSAIKPWKTLYSFQPIPQVEWTKEFKVGPFIEVRTYRQTGGDVHGIRVTTVGGEWGNWGDRYVKLPRTNYLRAEDLLKRARDPGAGDVFLTPVKRLQAIEVPAPHFAVPAGPVSQVSFAW